MTRALAFAIILAGCAGPAAAQNRGSKVSFLPQSEFHMTAARLGGSNDDRFTWDANFGGALDLVDYTSGRLIFRADYEAVLGKEFQAFDPNQGNYMLEGEMTVRLKTIEAGLVFHHVSRHLGDREKTQPVDWNMLGVRVDRSFLVNGAYIAVEGDLRWVTEHSFVDYKWETDANARIDRQFRPAAGVFGGGGFRYVGVDGTGGRGNQNGFHAEGGLRFEGGGGAVELFVGAERRIDPYPLEFSTATWLTAGFRLLSR